MTVRLEADAFCTALVEFPKGTAERFAFVMENQESDTKMYFFVTRDDVVAILASLVEQIGYDA